MTAATPEGAVAITGMACLFPSAPDLDAYWRNIVGKVDAVTDPPPGSWDPDVYYDPEFADQDATYCKRGGYLGSLASFAPLRHGIAVGERPVVGPHRALGRRAAQRLVRGVDVAQPRRVGDHVVQRRRRIGRIGARSPHSPSRRIMAMMIRQPIRSPAR